MKRILIIFSIIAFSNASANSQEIIPLIKSLNDMYEESNNDNIKTILRVDQNYQLVFSNGVEFDVCKIHYTIHEDGSITFKPPTNNPNIVIIDAKGILKEHKIRIKSELHDDWKKTFERLRSKLKCGKK